MTRANTEQIKHTPWFAKAGAACSIVPISRFVGPNIFALKGGGYGCLFSLSGLDEEALTDLELEARVRQVEGALRGLPEGSCLYQYTRVMSGFDLPRQKQYGNEVTETFASDRLAHLDKTAAFRRIDLHWCLTLEHKLLVKQWMCPLLVDDPALVTKVCQLDCALRCEAVISWKDDVKRRLGQLGHRQFCVSLRLRDERYIKVSAHQPVCQIGRSLTVDADFQVRVQGQSDGVENLYKDGVHIR
jgi:hypothetical protein